MIAKPSMFAARMSENEMQEQNYLHLVFYYKEMPALVWHPPYRPDRPRQGL